MALSNYTYSWAYNPTYHGRLHSSLLHSVRGSVPRLALQTGGTFRVAASAQGLKKRKPASNVF